MHIKLYLFQSNRITIEEYFFFVLPLCTYLFYQGFSGGNFGLLSLSFGFMKLMYEDDTGDRSANRGNTSPKFISYPHRCSNAMRQLTHPAKNVQSVYPYGKIYRLFRY